MTRLRRFAATARQAPWLPRVPWLPPSGVPWLPPLGGSLSTSLQRAAATVTAVLIGGTTTVFACPMCFGADDSPLIDGAKLGVLVMVAITLAVQGAFVAFFLYLRRRAKRIADLDLDTEWAELQRPSRTS